MNSIVGYTGFVGSNIYENGSFDCAYNSRNIEESFGTNPDLLIYAGLRAEKYLANSNPEKDMELIEQAMSNIEKISPKKLVLISTIDVFKVPVDVDENTAIDTDNLHPYGLHRYLLESWVRENYPDALIVRLPALFGKNIKKNFIFDYLNPVPSMLKTEKAVELGVSDYYEPQSSGFSKLKADAPKALLKDLLEEKGFTALNFTDSRSIYQFYPLKKLWNDIETALENGITLQHMATEPVSSGELYKYLTGTEFCNELKNSPAYYDYRTVNADIYGGSDGYILKKNDVLKAVSAFIKEYK